MKFQKATKSQAKLRAALFGPSGAGKTYSCLRIATGLGGPIAVIDTERGSASKYADRFEFDVLDLQDKSIEGYTAAIKAAAAGGYPVLVIDSLSHGWQELLAEVDRLAKAKYRGNTWSAWSDGTPKQRRLVDAILSYPGHVLATIRSRTEWTEEKDSNGKMRPVRVGMAPEQGKGIEYEFDVLVELNVDHIANIIKDRSGRFQDKTIEKPGEEFGQELAAWLDQGVAPPPPPPARTGDGEPVGMMEHHRQVKQAIEEAKGLGLTAADVREVLGSCGFERLSEIGASQASTVIAELAQAALRLTAA
jgi:hypothetical protein